MSENTKLKRAWSMTLDSLDKIFDFCKERHLPVLLVVFSYTIQFEDVDSLSLPQKRVSEREISSGVPVIDSLPIMNKIMTEQRMIPGDLFIVDDHLSEISSKVAAEKIADFIIKKKQMTEGVKN